MKKTILIILSFILPLAVSAQEKMSLKDCIEIGLERNYDIKLSRNEQQIADNNATIGNAGFLPQLDLNGGYSGTVNNIDQRTTEGIVNKNNGVHNQALNVGLNLNWTLFDGFQMQTNYSRLKELKQKGELSTRLSIENFIANLSAEYYNYIQQGIRLDNLGYAVKLSRERLRIVEARYQIGSASRLELQQAKVDFNADSSKMIKQHEVLFRSKMQLSQLLVLDDRQQSFVPEKEVIEFDPLLNKDNIWTKSLTLNTLLLLSQKEKSLSQLDLKSTQSQNYPYLRLNAGYGYVQNYYGSGAYDRQGSLGLNYGLTVGFNLFDGNNKKRKQRNAKIEIENSELEYQQLQLSLKTDLENIWMAYQNNMQLTNLEKENRQTAQSNYEIAMERYKLGDLAGIELREAQNSLLEAEDRLIQAQYNTKLCEISLNQISGQITTYLNENN